MVEYTKSELKLIKKLSSHFYTLIINGTDFTPSTLYRMLVEEVFIDNRKGPEVDALRRVYTAIMKCTVYRHTNEFDKLCEF